MSIRVMSRIWEHGPEDREELLVLLSLADFADDSGRCYPSMAAVARKARLSERGAQKIIRRLQADGWLSVETGGGRKACNVYTIANPERGSENQKPRTGNTEPRSGYRPEKGERRSGYEGGKGEPRSPISERKPRTGVQETPNTGSPEPSGTVVREDLSPPPPPVPGPARDSVGVAVADAIEVTDRIADALGADPSKHPAWATGAIVVARWIQAGVPASTAIAAARAERIRRDAKGHGPPNGPAYIEQAVMRLHASASAPVATPDAGAPRPMRSKPPTLTPEQLAARDRLAGGAR